MKNPDAIYAFNFPYTQPQVSGTGWTKKNMEQKIKQKNQSQN